MRANQTTGGLPLWLVAVISIHRLLRSRHSMTVFGARHTPVVEWLTSASEGDVSRRTGAVYVFAGKGGHTGPPLRPFLRVLRAFACAIPSFLEKTLVQICNFCVKKLDTKTTFCLSWFVGGDFVRTRHAIPRGVCVTNSLF